MQVFTNTQFTRSRLVLMLVLAALGVVVFATTAGVALREARDDGRPLGSATLAAPGTVVGVDRADMVAARGQKQAIDAVAAAPAAMDRADMVARRDAGGCGAKPSWTLLPDLTPAQVWDCTGNVPATAFT